MGFFDDEITTVPDTARSFGFTTERDGRLGWERVLPIDVEILRLLLAAKYVRAFQLGEWLGAGGRYVHQRLSVLKKMGLVGQETFGCRLRDSVSSTVLSPRIVKAWFAREGARELVGGWQVLGEPEGCVVLPLAHRFTNTLGDHTLGAVDLAVLYRRWGFGVVFEREFKGVEMPVGRQGDVSLPVVWCPRVSSRVRHAPDLGVVAPDGSRWGVELELSTKPVRDYKPVVGSFLDAGLGQIWHCRSGAAARNVVAALGDFGVGLREFSTGSGPVLASGDGLVRVVRWESGFVSPARMGSWADVWGQWGVVPPAGFPVPGGGLVDLSRSWRLR